MICGCAEERAETQLQTMKHLGTSHVGGENKQAGTK